MLLGSILILYHGYLINQTGSILKSQSVDEERADQHRCVTFLRRSTWYCFDVVTTDSLPYISVVVIVPKSSSLHQFPRLSILNLDQTYPFICFDMPRHCGSVRGICWHILPFVATYDYRTLKEAFLSYLSSTLFCTRRYCSEYRCASARKIILYHLNTALGISSSAYYDPASLFDHTIFNDLIATRSSLV
jgi:hypothetical protein